MFNSPQICIAEALDQGITAEKREGFFIYPAPTHRAETRLLHWRTENIGAPVTLSAARWCGKGSVPGNAICED